MRFLNNRIKMKNLSQLLLLGCALIVFSCKKDHSKAPDTNTTTGEKRHVSFNINNAVLQTNSLNGKLKTNAIADTSKFPLKQLGYFVYNQSGALVHSIFQDTSSSNFGVINDEYAPGTYTIVFAACNPAVPNSNFYNITGLKAASFTGLDKSTDFFYKKINITVAGADINQQVSLNRIAGKLQVIIQDTIPSDVTNVYVNYNSFSTFSFNTDTITNQASSTIYRRFTASDVGKSNLSLSGLAYNIYSPFTVTISSSSATKQRPNIVVTGVVCQSNKVTVLSGKVFQNATSQYNSGFQITLNPDWGPTTTTKF
jgi:hypothetical protein